MLEYGPTHTADDDVELETALQELVLNLLRDSVETNIGVGTDLIGGDGGHGENDGGGRAGDEVHDADAEGMEVDDNTERCQRGNAQNYRPLAGHLLGR